MGTNFAQIILFVKLQIIKDPQESDVVLSLFVRYELFQAMRKTSALLATRGDRVGSDHKLALDPTYRLFCKTISQSGNLVFLGWNFSTISRHLWSSTNRT